MTVKKLIFSIIFIFTLQNIMAAEITAKEIEASMKGEFSRGFNAYGNMALIGGIELNNVLKFRTGISLGKTAAETDLSSFFNIRYSPFSRIPFVFSLVYIYNGELSYDIHTHTIFPVISFNASRAGISIGANFRFTSYFGEKAVFETILSLYAYLNFVNNNMLNIGIGIGNFCDFNAKNLSALSLRLYATVHVNKNWSIINEAELMQSGIDGLSTNFYGFSWRAGARYSW